MRFKQANAIRVAAVSIGLAMLVVSGCQPKDSKKNLGGQSNPLGPTVVVANYPIQFFVESLVEDKVTVVGPGPNVSDARSWSPDDATISSMQHADLILAVGADYEKWPQFVTLPEGKTFEVSRGLIADFISVEGEVHKHGPDGAEHTHTGFANCFWLDPKLGKRIMESIAKSLSETYPEHADLIESNRKKMNRRFADLEKKMESAKPRHAVWYSSDTRYQYLSRRFGTTDVYFFWTSHGKEELPEKAFAQLDEKLSTTRPGVMLFPFSPSTQTKAELDKRGIDVMVVDTIETEGGGDYFERLERVVELLTAD